MDLITRFGTCLDKNYKLLVLLALSIQVVSTFILVFTYQLTWDRGLWYSIVAKMPEEIPYLTTDSFIHGGNDYPIFLTYYLLMLKPFSWNFESFSIALGLTQVIASAVIFYYTTKLLVHFKLSKYRLIGLAAAPVYTLLAVVRFDLIPAALTVAALYYLLKSRVSLSALLAAIGFCFKLFPIVLLAAAFRRHKFKKYLLVFTLSVIIIYLPALLTHPITILTAFQPAAPRPESFFGLLGLLGLSVPYYSIINYSLMGFLLAIVIIKKSRKPLNITICLIITLLVTSTIFSPQWTVWILPLLLIAGFNPVVVLAYDWITIIEFPFVWMSVFSLTNGFDYSMFAISNPLVLLFVILNFARYALLYYFYAKSL